MKVRLQSYSGEGWHAGGKGVWRFNGRMRQKVEGGAGQKPNHDDQQDGRDWGGKKYEAEFELVQHADGPMPARKDHACRTRGMRRKALRKRQHPGERLKQES